MQSKCPPPPPNTNRLALFLYLGMFNIISVINLWFWSESTSWHFEGSCIFYSWNGNVRACHISLLPLSMVLVKHVISARACKGCVHVLVHESVCFCVCARACAQMCDTSTISPAEALLLLLCRNTWQHMTEQLEHCYWSAQAANSNHISEAQLILSVFECVLLIQEKNNTVHSTCRL